MVGRVALALVAALTTGHDACVERHAHDDEVHVGLAADDAADRVADTGAVVTEPDAPDQVDDVGLAEAGVGAGVARGRAVDALVDTAQERVAVEADGPRMPLDDLSDRHFALLHVEASWAGRCRLFHLRV